MFYMDYVTKSKCPTTNSLSQDPSYKLAEKQVESKGKVLHNAIIF